LSDLPVLAQTTRASEAAATTLYMSRTRYSKGLKNLNVFGRLNSCRADTNNWNAAPQQMEF
jgi:hypothetical protein